MAYLISLVFVAVFGIISGKNFSTWINDQENTNNLVFAITSFIFGIGSSFLMLLW